MAILPNAPVLDEKMHELIKRAESRKKRSSIFVVAENDVPGRAYDLQKLLMLKYNIDSHVCILGHIQRGGSPSCFDRLIASRMGFHAVESLLEGRKNVMVGIVNNKMSYIPLKQALKAKNKFDAKWLEIVKILAS
jgi:6-phosphofructokinase 1